MAEKKEQLQSGKDEIMETADGDNLNEELEVVEVDVEDIEVEDAEALTDGAEEASVDSQRGSNRYLRAMMESNYIEYASYVIKERAIPDVDDGLKPVQRRILWSLFRMDDGKFHKVANVIGHTMQYHPHGDASIGGALVVLANKEYFIEKQGNFGNIFTGDSASAARYIECRLSPLALEVLFNSDITEFIDSYDGRNREPIALPVKIPSLLMLGTQGIAVGMATTIMPHNFNELLQAQISVLRKESFELYPDFLQGGLMDVSEYDQGNGKIILRAKIERDGRKLIIREIPATTTTEKLIQSIEKAVDRSKIKVAAINDYTTEDVEIEIVPMRGQDPDKMVNALYRYTDCEISVSVNMMVICENRPVQMNVDSVIRRNTERLLEYLKRELEIELGKLNELWHSKTLAQIFIENRIYKRIEECKTAELVLSEIYKGFEPFTQLLNREITDDDIKKLLAIPIGRISRFDIDKNRREITDIEAKIAQIKKHLKRLTAYAIKYLEALLTKYGEMFPRCTCIEALDKVDRRAVALNNIKVGWDRKHCYIGTNVKSDDQVTCNEFDHLLCLERKGNYKVINIPDKIFIGRLYEFRKYDKDIEFGVIYRENKTGKFYGKRCFIDKYIAEREYMICPKGCRLEVFTARTDAIYKCLIDIKRGDNKLDINLKELPLRSARARGVLVSSKPVIKINHKRYLNEEELEAYSAVEIVPAEASEQVERLQNEEGKKIEEVEKVEEIEKAGKHETTEKVKKVKKAEKVEKIEKVEKVEKIEKAKKVEKAGKHETTEKVKKVKKAEKVEKIEKGKKVEEVEEIEEIEEIEKAGKRETTEKAEKAKKVKKAEKSEEPAKSDSTTSTVSSDRPSIEEEVPPKEEEHKTPLADKATTPDEPDDDNWGIIQPEFGF